MDDEDYAPENKTGSRAKRKKSSGWGFKKNEEAKKSLIIPINNHNTDKPTRQKKKKGKEEDEEDDDDDVSDSSVIPLSVKSSDPKASLLTNNQIIDLYSNCIKLSTENKINVKNTWSLNLIDYIDDVIEQQHTGDITNFQAASCTLDASIKIYSSRVDSIHESAYKVLGGLNLSESKGAPSSQEEKSSQEDEDNTPTSKPSTDSRKEEEEDNTSSQPKTPKKSPRLKKIISRGLNTLEPNPESLEVKKFDLEFEVDPLFRKTSAAFDEGGARGLLLNNLSLSTGGNLILDSADAPLHFQRDYSKDRKDELALCDFSQIKDLILDINSKIDKQEICPTFTNFHFQRDSKDLNKSNKQDFNLVDEPSSTPDDLPLDPASDDDDLENFEAASQMEENLFQEIAQEGRRGLDVEQDEGESANRDYFLALDAVPSVASKGGVHWKYTTKLDDKDKEEGEEGEEGQKKKRKKKEAFFVDFEAKLPDLEQAFAKPKNKATTQLSTAVLEKSTASLTIIPLDYNVSITHLFRLFLKPDAPLKTSSSSGVTKPLSQTFRPFGEHVSDDGDTLFDNHDGAMLMEDEDERVGPGLGLGPDHLHLGEGASPQEQMLLISEPRKVQKIDINYDKVNKSVNMKALKNCLWKCLCSEGDDNEVVDDNTDDDDEEHLKNTKKRKKKQKPHINKKKKFSRALVGMNQTLSNEEAPGASVPLCFICLLHLANENQLLLSQKSLDEVTIAQG